MSAQLIQAYRTAAQNGISFFDFLRYIANDPDTPMPDAPNIQDQPGPEIDMQDAAIATVDNVTEMTDVTYPLEEFRLFPVLPVELRIKIWGFALPDNGVICIKGYILNRVVHPSEPSTTTGEVSNSSATTPTFDTYASFVLHNTTCLPALPRPVALLATNYESRSVFLEKFPLSLPLTTSPSPPSNPPTTNPTTIMTITLTNPNNNIVNVARPPPPSAAPRVSSQPKPSSNTENRIYFSPDDILYMRNHTRHFLYPTFWSLISTQPWAQRITRIAFPDSLAVELESEPRKPRYDPVAPVGWQGILLALPNVTEVYGKKRFPDWERRVEERKNRLEERGEKVSKEEEARDKYFWGAMGREVEADGKGEKRWEDRVGKGLRWFSF